MNALHRRPLLLAGVSLLLASCAAPLPAPVMLRLPVGHTGSDAPPNRPLEGPLEGPPLRLLSLRLAGHLDRDALVVATGPVTLQASLSARWAEPLREAAARALQHDLDPAGTLPAGGSATGVTGARVELQVFELQADRRSLRLEAVWQFEGGSGGRQRFFTEVQTTGTGLDEAVLAHREALFRLARHLRQQAARPGR